MIVATPIASNASGLFKGVSRKSYYDLPKFDSNLVMPKLFVAPNSNDDNFLLGCLIASRNISRRSKLNVDALSKFKRH